MKKICMSIMFLLLPIVVNAGTWKLETISDENYNNYEISSVGYYDNSIYFKGKDYDMSSEGCQSDTGNIYKLNSSGQFIKANLFTNLDDLKESNKIGYFVNSTDHKLYINNSRGESIYCRITLAAMADELVDSTRSDYSSISCDEKICKATMTDGKVGVLTSASDDSVKWIISPGELLKELENEEENDHIYFIKSSDGNVQIKSTNSSLKTITLKEYNDFMNWHSDISYIGSTSTDNYFSELQPNEPKEQQYIFKNFSNIYITYNLYLSYYNVSNEILSCEIEEITAGGLNDCDKIMNLTSNKEIATNALINKLSDDTYSIITSSNVKITKNKTQIINQSYNLSDGHFGTSAYDEKNNTYYIMNEVNGSLPWLDRKSQYYKLSYVSQTSDEPEDPTPSSDATINITLDSLELYKDKSYQLEYSLSDSSKKIKWSSSDSSVVSVDDTGMITGLQIGTAQITATIEDNDIKDSVTVKVISSANNISITFKEKNKICNLGEECKVEATVNNYSNSDEALIIEYSSSNPNIASIDEYGNITTKQTGTVTITAKYGDLTDTMELQIVSNPHTGTSLSVMFIIVLIGGYFIVKNNKKIVKKQIYKI